MLWVPITIAASLSQVLRNGAQASLTHKIGMLGATQVRFVFGLPFAAVFFGFSLLIFQELPPSLNGVALAWTTVGAMSQIGATALMLFVMHQRAFGVAYAYIKTEPVIVAIMGAALLGDRLDLLGWIAVIVVTVGVLVTSVHPQQFGELFKERKMIAAGVTSGGLFGLSAIAFRAAINSIPEGSFVVRSMETLLITLAIQTLLLGIWLAWRDRAAFAGSIMEWRRSVGAGFLGAVASACWFAAFALTPAANVRTLGLIEMPLAAALSKRMTGKKMAAHELLGLTIVTIGILLLLASVAPRSIGK